MKFTDGKEKYLDLKEGLEESYEEEQEFWKTVEGYIIHGVPATDQKGHWMELRVRVRPVQLDLINAVREKHPPGMYKSQADLVRSLIATGTKTHLEFFKRKKTIKWEDVETMLNELNLLGREQRRRELRKEVQHTINTILTDESYNADEKSKVIDLLSQMEKRIAQL